jgi:RNA polymerase sigma-70 factor (ECF subfamily)
MLDDKRLIWRLRRADVDALRRLYDKYKGDLLKLAVILTGDLGHAEDVVQDVFLKLARSYDRIGIHGNLRNYLITCVVNQTRTLRRDVARRQQTSLDPEALSPCPAPRPEQWAVLNEQTRQLAEAMNQLPPEQREVVTLRFQAGLGFRRIARIQKAPINTVQGRYRYGMEKLRALFNGEVT